MKHLAAFTLLSLVLSFQLTTCHLTEECCMHLPNLLPLRLRDMRVKFDEIKDYFQAQDDELSIQLLTNELLEDFKSYLGCQSVSDMIHFYLEEVLPKAIMSNKTVERGVDSIENMLQELRQTLKRCHRFFLCEKRTKTIKEIKGTYEKLQEKGIYKAMGEFDTFINYIEEYLTLKMRK
uniref:Interleukin family protein n=1 Tax=Sphenodon punctatus TaxID=8508 RepID=A0A8D0GME2_SPHPU